ncbi:MAG: hypothetical protein LBK61_04875, partial [Spirochaetaceae bacterium]|nr:hypothetical protein [Spirochaetaceae bacterium]
PDGVYKRLTTSGIDDTYACFIAECHGCACCESVCPSRLPLRAVIKGLVNQDGLSIQNGSSIKNSLPMKNGLSTQDGLPTEKPQ